MVTPLAGGAGIQESAVTRPGRQEPMQDCHANSSSIMLPRQDPMLLAAASQAVLKLPLHASRQCPALRRQVRPERGVVFLNERTKKGVLRLVAHIRRRADTRTEFPASLQWQQDRLLARSS